MDEPKTAIAISSYDTLGNAQIKLISGVNPNAKNSKLSTFSKKTNSLTTNIYRSTTRIDRTDITDADKEGD